MVWIKLVLSPYQQWQKLCCPTPSLQMTCDTGLTLHEGLRPFPRRRDHVATKRNGVTSLFRDMALRVLIPRQTKTSAISSLLRPPIDELAWSSAQPQLKYKQPMQGGKQDEASLGNRSHVDRGDRG